jgi:hypothetical protein
MTRNLEWKINRQIFRIYYDLVMHYNQSISGYKVGIRKRGMRKQERGMKRSYIEQTKVIVNIRSLTHGSKISMSIM